MNEQDGATTVFEMTRPDGGSFGYGTNPDGSLWFRDSNIDPSVGFEEFRRQFREGIASRHTGEVAAPLVQEDVGRADYTIVYNPLLALGHMLEFVRAFPPRDLD